ncbi:MAG TPA: FtsQ-type POTRA domain-containing protein [Candidatus Limnocylindria bacterium]
MKLKPQPRPTRRPQRPPRTVRRPARGAARSRGAQRPRKPLRRRIAAHLPSLARAGAVLGAVAATAALGALLNGPWLRVTDVTFAGQHHTAAADLERVLLEQRGRSVLAVDTASIRARIEGLPAVGEATVSATLLGRIEATVVEHEVAFVWQTASGRFLGAADGTIFAALADDEALPAGVEPLPQIQDERFVARLITVGDVIPAGVVGTALRLFEIDPAALGSAASQLSLRLDDEYGFRLVSAAPEWQVALGPYGLDPMETETEAAARLDAQVAAVRTLFATRAEADIGWVDVRNPGKVYFRAKG